MLPTAALTLCDAPQAWAAPSRPPEGGQLAGGGPAFSGACARARALLAGAVLLGTACAALAQVAVVPGADGRFRYTQDFNTLPAAASARWLDDATLPGWLLRNFVDQPLVSPTLRVDHGSSSSGSFFSYGLPGSSQRALGAIGAGTFYWGTPAPGERAGYIALGLRNDSGQAIAQLQLAYSGQQWRQAPADDVHSIVVEWGLAATPGQVSQWQPAGSSLQFDSPSPQLVSPAGAALDGSAADASRRLSRTLALQWPAGQTLWLRWVFLNNHDNDHGLAIDDVQVDIDLNASATLATR